MEIKELQRIIVLDGFKLLTDSKGYQQVEVIEKMHTLGLIISKSSFSNIINNKIVGPKALLTVSEGVQEIVKAELGLRFHFESRGYVSILDWEERIIPTANLTKENNDKGLVFYEHGRISIAEKLSWMQEAQDEIIEFGLRLNAFTSYFYHRNEFEFKRPLLNLLDAGVNLKLYMINPESNEARLYFNDRARIDPEESDSIELIKGGSKRLLRIAKEVALNELAGSVQLFNYSHIPHSHFLIIDGKKNSGVIFVANYLYGVKRADCPVVRVSKQKNPDLFNKYYNSFKSLSTGAKPVVAE